MKLRPKHYYTLSLLLLFLTILIIFGQCKKEELFTKPILRVVMDSSNLKATSVIAFGEVIDPGNSSVTEYGFCWSDESVPSLENAQSSSISSNSPSPTGQFQAAIDQLEPNMQYFLIAYAKTKEAGNAYSEIIEFFTQSGEIILQTDSIQLINDSTVLVGGEIVSDGGSDIYERGIYWDTTASFNTMDSILVGKGPGQFSDTLTNLQSGKTYFIKAYARNELQKAVGEVKIYARDVELMPKTPTVITNDVIDIYSNSAIVGGNVVDTGTDAVTDRGIYWGTNNDIDSTDNKLAVGNGIGEFSDSLSGLSTSTKYYIRAYAVNNVGIGYGSVKEFTTLHDLAPVADFEANVREINVGGTVNFSDLSDNEPVEWEWNFGDGNTSTDQNPQHTYNEAGVYTVSLTVTNSYGSDVETKNDYITVNAEGMAPEVDFTLSDNTILVNEQEVTFTDQSANSPTSWMWYFGDGNTSTEQNPQHTFTSTGTYDITLVATNEYGKDSLTQTDFVVVGEAPTASFTADDYVVYEGQTINFNNASTNSNSWMWDFGDGNTSTLQEPSHSYANEGTYTVTLNASNNFGSDTSTLVDYIEVGLEIDASFTADDYYITPGQTVNFENETTNADNYIWYFGDGNTSTESEPSHTYNDEGTYTVSLVATNAYDKDSFAIDNYINVGQPPTAAFTADDYYVTPGQNVNFQNTSSNSNSWKWYFGDGNTSTVQEPSYSYSSTGTYTISLVAYNSYGQDSTALVDYINVGLAPVAEFTADDTDIAEGETVNFTDQSTNSPDNWNWTFGDSNSSTQQNPSNIYNTQGLYTVTLEVSNEYGADTQTKTDYITVSESQDTTGTVTDIDGNTYQTIKIGDQWWMAGNLAVTQYNDGTSIPNVTDNSTWANTTSPAYCWYNDDEATYKDPYGALYNWYTVDQGNLCPTGWHVPTDAEFKELEMSAGMSQSEADATGWRGAPAGGNLKEAGTSHWNSPNTDATNSTGFTALPSGIRADGGSGNQFLNNGSANNFWTSTFNGSTNNAWTRYFKYDEGGIDRNANQRETLGFSVRCVKDE